MSLLGVSGIAQNSCFSLQERLEIGINIKFTVSESKYGVSGTITMQWPLGGTEVGVWLFP